MLGAIEAGGTKFVCAVSTDDYQIIERVSIPTTTPDETMSAVMTFFDYYSSSLEAIGIGSFGPIDINRESETYGWITSTPKNHWSNTPIVPVLKARYNIPVAWTTDVNAAAFGEFKLGAAKECHSCLYLTVGTGIGGGAIINDHLLSGRTHPEMGHIMMQQHPNDSYQGHCPFHQSCLEGMASGPAIEERVGKKGQFLSENHPIWQIVAYYLAQAIMDYTLILSPEKVILGGGVMKQTQLFNLIRKSFDEQMNHYVALPNLDEYIVPCKLKDNAGIMGALLLAKEELQS